MQRILLTEEEIAEHKATLAKGKKVVTLFGRTIQNEDELQEVLLAEAARLDAIDEALPADPVEMRANMQRVVALQAQLSAVGADRDAKAALVEKLDDTVGALTNENADLKSQVETLTAERDDALLEASAVPGLNDQVAKLTADLADAKAALADATAKAKSKPASNTPVSDAPVTDPVVVAPVPTPENPAQPADSNSPADTAGATPPATA